MNESPRIKSSVEGESFVRVATFLYAFTGIVLPLIAFACAAPRGNWMADTPWQTSEFWVYATLVLKWPAAAAFYPLLLASIASMALFVWDRERFGQWLLVRIGLYGGVLLAAQFSWLIYAPTDEPVEAIVKTALAVLIIQGVGHLALILVAVATLSFVEWIKDRSSWRGFAVWVAIVACSIVAATLAYGELFIQRVAVVLFLALALTLAASPALALAAYVMASISVATAPPEPRIGWSIKSILGITTWIACQLGSWRQAMNLAILEYAALPTEDPSCFVCSAAARGHPWLVGSEPVQRPDGAVVWISYQLRVFKAAELALLAVAPRAHRSFRLIYNAVGPQLAARMTHPWLADMVYATLKPFEWSAAVLLWMLGVSAARVAALYSPISAHEGAEEPTAEL
jgi:hypothetical protein